MGRGRLGGAVLSAALLAASASGFAAPINPDLSIGGSVSLRNAPGVSPFSDGNVTQTGAIRATVGGVTTAAGFTTAPGPVDGVNDGTVGPAPNPLLAAFTDTGDGLGWSTDVDAAFQTDFYNFIVDFGFSLSNASAVDTYTVTMRVNYSNVVDADGVDAYAQAGLDVELDNVDVFRSDVLSDTFFGDELNGVGLGTFGALVSDAGVFDFVVVLAPGASATVGATHQWEGAVFEPGFSFVDLGVDLSIADVACAGPCGQQPPAAPEPGTLALLGLGLSGLALRRRRARA